METDLQKPNLQKIKVKSNPSLFLPILIGFLLVILNSYHIGIKPIPYRYEFHTDIYKKQFLKSSKGFYFKLQW